MAADPPFYHDQKYQCWCGVNAERAAFIIGVLGIVWSCLSLSIISLVAYVCIVIAIRTRNPTYYKVFAFIAGLAIGAYIAAIALLVAWFVLVDTHGAYRAYCLVGLILAVVELLLQFWVCWIMKRAFAYTTAVRDFERANCHSHQQYYVDATAYPSAYQPYTASLSSPTSNAKTAYPSQATYPQQPQFLYPQNT